MDSGSRIARPVGSAIINAGAFIAVLLGVPCVFISLFGIAGVLTGKKIVAGALGALWGYAAAAGAYELNRRRFQWSDGRKYRDVHLLAGMLAVSTGLMLGGAMHETMPVLALLPALSALIQASDRHDNRLLTFIHAAVLSAGLGAGVWFYRNGVIGGVILDRIAALP